MLERTLAKSKRILGIENTTSLTTRGRRTISFDQELAYESNRFDNKMNIIEAGTYHSTPHPVEIIHSCAHFCACANCTLDNNKDEEKKKHGIIANRQFFSSEMSSASTSPHGRAEEKE